MSFCMRMCVILHWILWAASQTDDVTCNLEQFGTEAVTVEYQPQDESQVYINMIFRISYSLYSNRSFTETFMVDSLHNLWLRLLDCPYLWLWPSLYMIFLCSTPYCTFTSSLYTAACVIMTSSRFFVCYDYSLISLMAYKGHCRFKKKWRWGRKVIFQEKKPLSKLI